MALHASAQILFILDLPRRATCRKGLSVVFSEQPRGRQLGNIWPGAWGAGCSNIWGVQPSQLGGSGMGFGRRIKAKLPPLCAARRPTLLLCPCSFSGGEDEISCWGMGGRGQVSVLRQSGQVLSATHPRPGPVSGTDCRARPGSLTPAGAKTQALWELAGGAGAGRRGRGRDLGSSGPHADCDLRGRLLSASFKKRKEYQQVDVTGVAVK